MYKIIGMSVKKLYGIRLFGKFIPLWKGKEQINAPNNSGWKVPTKEDLKALENFKQNEKHD